MANSPIHNWISSTVRIENEWGGSGTGFLIAKQVEPNKHRVFLVTNKHVVNIDKDKRDEATKLTFHLNMGTRDGPVKANRVEFRLPTEKSSVWREHPDENVDVMAIDVTGIFVNISLIRNIVMPFDGGVATKEKISELCISMGDEIFIIGYPSIFPFVISHGETNYPFIRQGIISSQVGYCIEENDGKRIRKLRGFLIDGGIVPGSSGSPVILKPASGRLVNNTVMMSPPPALLLGIVAEQRFVPFQHKDGVQCLPTNMGFAFESETIIETINLFF